MASTIQDCASLSAAERRQMRKERILGKADVRLEKILPDMVDSVVPDMIDDMADLDSSVCTAKDLDLNSSIATAKEFNLDDIMPDDTQSFAEETINNRTAELDYVEPNYMDLINIRRVECCIIAGKLPLNSIFIYSDVFI